MSIPTPNPPPGPGPRRSDRRDQILREAAECFAARGFSGTTTRELAARVGITEAALYRHFASKEALYAAIIDAKIAAPDLIAPLEEAARAGDDVAVFSGLARANLEGGYRDPAFFRILLFTALEGHSLAEPFFEARVRRLREFLTRYIERRIAEGAFRPMDAVLAGRAFLGMILDHLLVKFVFRQDEVYPQSLDEVVDALVSTFLHGVLRP
jgi:AcrR family transcriptional regulator